MAQQESGWVLEQHPDPETFRRVWARVMPDGEGSPIALEPEPSERTEQQERPPEERSGPEREPGASLEMLIDRTRAAFESAQHLARRAGRYGQSVGAVAAEDRTALRRFSAAYYLETGRDYRSNRTPQSPEPLALAPALRRQYQREEELEGLCEPNETISGHPGRTAGGAVPPVPPPLPHPPPDPGAHGAGPAGLTLWGQFRYT